MEGDMDENVRERRLEFKSCFIHFKDVSQSLMQISQVGFKKLISCRKRWVALEGEKTNLCRESCELFSDEEVANYFENDRGSNVSGESQFIVNMHENCYKRICDENKIQKAEEKFKLTTASAITSTASTEEVPRKSTRLEIRRDIIPTKRRNGNVLAVQCIICKKATDKFVWKLGKRKRMPLVSCETEDAGLLREAATRKKDEKILLQIREHKEIKYMTYFYKKFLETVKEIENVDASSFRRFRLKQRLTKLYPQLVFHTPKIRNESEIVYVENLSSKDLVDDYMLNKGSDNEIDENDCDYDVECEKGNVKGKSFDDPAVNEVQILYHAAMLLKNKVNKFSLDTPWPPLAADITEENVKKIVQPILFNMLAWICGFSDDPQLDDYVSVKDSQYFKIMSLAQDLLFISSDGKKPTPKSISLAMALRQLTGSSTVLKLVNNFGHSMSHRYVLRHETALAELNVSSQGTLPPGFSRNECTTLAWDNDDFCEETKTGKGTTHITGGIILQRENSNDKEAEPVRENMSRSSLLNLEPEEIEPYVLGRKVTVNLKKALNGISVDELFYMPKQDAARKLDFSFVLCRDFQNELLLPNWTGFNTLLQAKEIPVVSKIGYLPIINASPTKFSTINAILQRSTQIANKLCVPYVCLVFDEAVYAKIQQVRWKNEAYLSRFITRLGEFHMATSFCSAIAKLFKDAGLRDLLVESELVAEGSINGVLNGKHYNRSVRAHKTLYEAFTRLLFAMYLDSLPTKSQEEILTLIECMADAYPDEEFKDYVLSPQLEFFQNKFNIYVKEKSQTNKTMTLWMVYMEMVQTLLVFIRATRENDWELHLSAVRSMLPWFFAADRFNYARYGSIYWLEMISINETHPDALPGIKANWTCQRQGRYGFSSIACDQVMEQTFNRDSKTKGGLTGFTLNKSAVQRWILAQS
eukprot:gene1845-2078_t